MIGVAVNVILTITRCRKTKKITSIALIQERKPLREKGRMKSIKQVLYV